MISEETIIEFCRKHSQEQFHSPKNNITYSLWEAGKVSHLNAKYEVEENLEGFIGFGTSGGGEMLAVNKKSGVVYSVPFIPMDEQEAVQIAKDLGEFATLSL
jgi:hypothetical protein